jgi:hypothetical protein
VFRYLESVLVVWLGWVLGLEVGVLVTYAYCDLFCNLRVCVVVKTRLTERALLTALGMLSCQLAGVLTDTPTPRHPASDVSLFLSAQPAPLTFNIANSKF